MFAKISEYFNSVQTEMKRVTWLSKNEMFGSTVVVGVFSIVIAIFLFAIDFGLTEIVSRVLGGK
jgi:preprotein translocase subunit SecE